MFRVLLLLSCLIMLPVTVPAKESWSKLQTKNFLLVGDASVNDMKKIAYNLELFREVLAARLPGVKLTDAVPTTVVVFKNDVAFSQFKPEIKGKTQNEVAGYFLRREDKNYIVMPANHPGASPLKLIFHEYFHFVAYNNIRNLPAWLNEGLAEFYSTFKTTDNGKSILIGDIAVDRLKHIRRSSLIPLERLIKADYRSPYFTESGKAGIFYSQSWALVHYLVLGNNGQRHPQLKRFISQLSSNMSVEENFRQSFHCDYKVIEEELRAYIAQYSMPVLKAASDPQQPVKDLRIGELSAAMANFYKGDLLVRLQQLDEAEKFLTESLELDGNLAVSHMAMGRLRMAERRPAEAIDHLTRAVRLDDTDALGHYQLGMALARAERSDEAIAALKTAVERQPDLHIAHRELGIAYLLAGRDSEADTAFQEVIRRQGDDDRFYSRRSFINLVLGRGEPAAIDAMTYVRREGWQDRTSIYKILIAHIGYRRAGLTKEAQMVLAEAAEKIDASEWPHPLLRFLSGQLNPGELIKLAKDNDQLTEAHAYIGYHHLLNDNKEAALVSFHWVKEKGNKSFTEYEFALAELRKLETTATQR